MPIPDFQSLMLPILRALADGRETPLREVRSRVADDVGLTPEERQMRYPNGGQLVFNNRVDFALLHLRGAGLIERAPIAVYRLTPEGTNLMSSPPERVDMRFLRRYPAYVQWSQRLGSQRLAPENDATHTEDGESTDTPEEALDRAAEAIRKGLQDEILARVREAPPAFLEQVVIDLLIAMGYGGGDAARGRVTGRPGDGGIDGTIKEDPLGLDEIYVQAKRHADNNNVSAGDLQRFVGALERLGTAKGVFVTTSGFTRDAKDYAAGIQRRIVLIDGEELARLMVQHDIGVRVQACYKLKRIDEGYFDQEGL